MQAWWMLPVIGLSWTVVGSPAGGAAAGEEPRGAAQAAAQLVAATGLGATWQRTPRGDALAPDGAGAEELSAVERRCKAPTIGESDACAAFALAAGASVEIELKEVLDADGNKMAEEIKFRLWDVKGQTNVANFSLPVAGKRTYTNGTTGVLDLVVYVRGQAGSRERHVRFTYTK